MHEFFGIEKTLFSVIEGTWYNQAYIQTLAVIFKKKNYLEMFLDFIVEIKCEDQVNLMGSSLLETLCTSVYFNDDCINKLSIILTPELFKRCTEFIISRGNCSRATKALLLLFK